ncbi:MAG TPA: S41 family peptidase [Bacillales bacterium]|nr:S41 family peptidase [Bacillales bacterium]
MKLSKLTIALMLIAALIIGAGGMYVGMTGFQTASAPVPSQNTKQPPQQQQKKDASQHASDVSFASVKKAYSVISNSFYKNVDQDKLLNGAIRGMVESLGDRFSVYMDPKTAKQFTQSLASSYDGIGAEVTMVNGKVTIMSPFKGSPADKAGLRANDQIVSINGKSIADLNLYEAVQKIRGKKGTTVKLGVKRPGAPDVMKIKVTRGDIPIRTVYPDTVQKNGHLFGIIQISSFSRGTADDFKKALQDLEDKGIDGLVIDVRGNPGGYLGAVTKIGDLLIPKDEPIVQVEDRNGNIKRYFSSLKQKKDYPIVGLINGGSASAAEILSAALHEAGGYPLVGTTSFGKGTVQTEYDIGGGQLKLTIAKWLTPDGNWINKKGIKPSVKVQQPDYFHAHPITVKKGKPLTYNENNDKVKNAQIILKGLGFDPGREDGYFSKQTKDAVKAFQEINDLRTTGKINTKTASTLDKKILKAVKLKKNDAQLQQALTLLEKHQ